MNKYSVVIPLYNAEDTIISTIESVYCQTRFDLIDEIIIIDDGSTDNSYKIVNDFLSKTNDNKIVLVKKNNGGAASARNYGIKLAKNKWIALLDSDDLWKANKIEVQNDVLQSNSSIRAIGSNRENEIIKHGNRYNNQIYQITPFQYCMKNWPCTPSLIFDKTIFSHENYFDENLSHAEEGIFFLDISAISGLYYHTDSLVICGDGKPSFGYSGLSGNIKKMHKGIITVMKIAKNKGYITKFNLVFLCIIENIKYIRRIMIVKKRKMI